MLLFSVTRVKLSQVQLCFTAVFIWKIILIVHHLSLGAVLFEPNYLSHVHLSQKYLSQFRWARSFRPWSFKLQSFELQFFEPCSLKLKSFKPQLFELHLFRPFSYKPKYIELHSFELWSFEPIAYYYCNFYIKHPRGIVAFTFYLR